MRYGRGRRRLFNGDALNGDLWPTFRSLLPSITRDWNVPPSELILGVRGR